MTTSPKVLTKNEQIEIIRLDQLVRMLTTSKVFSDTTLWMHPGIGTDKFIEWLALAVEKSGQKLRVLQSTREELNRKGEEGDLKGMMGQSRLLEAIERGLVVIVQSNNTHFSDSSFITLAMEARLLAEVSKAALVSAPLEDTKTRVSIITGDQPLARDLLKRVDALVGLESVRTPCVRVYNIDRYGFPVAVAKNTDLTSDRPSGGRYKSFHRRKDSVVPLDHEISDALAPTVGDTVITDSGERFTLGEEVSFGAEAGLYKVSEDTVAKIYHVPTEHRRLKVDALCQRSFDIQGVCFPQQMLYAEDGHFCGFTQPLVHGIELEELFYEDKRDEYAPDFDRKNYVQIAVALAARYNALGHKGLMVGDYNGRNVLVGLDEKGHASLDAGLWLVDIDSCQLSCDAGTLPAQGLSPEYSAPELLSAPQDPYEPRKMSSDQFSQALMLLQIVMGGIHPFRSCGENFLTENIRKKIFPYGSKDIRAAAKPPESAELVWSLLPRNVKTVFADTLTCEAEKRATTQTLLKHLEAYEQWFESKGKLFPEARELYPTKKKPHWVKCSSCGQLMDLANGGGLTVTDHSGTRYMCRDCASEGIVCQGCGRDDVWSRGDVFLGKTVHKFCPGCYAKKKAGTQPASSTQPDPAQAAQPVVSVSPEPDPAVKYVPKHAAKSTAKPAVAAPSKPTAKLAPKPKTTTKPVSRQKAAPKQDPVFEWFYKEMLKPIADIISYVYSALFE